MKKRISIIFLTALLILGLCACAEKKETDSYAPHTVEYNHTVYTVTPADGTTGTISDGTDTYSYQYEPRIGGYRVKFTYPDGETYTWTDDGSSMSGTTSPGFDFEKYPDGWTLSDILLQSSSVKNARKTEKTEKNVGLILLLLIVGAVNMIWPQATWYLDVGWKVKDAEPSEGALAYGRVIGVVLLIIAVIMIIA